MLLTFLDPSKSKYFPENAQSQPTKRFIHTVSLHNEAWSYLLIIQAVTPWSFSFCDKLSSAHRIRGDQEIFMQICCTPGNRTREIYKLDPGSYPYYLRQLFHIYCKIVTTNESARVVFDIARCFASTILKKTVFGDNLSLYIKISLADKMEVLINLGIWSGELWCY